MASKVTFHFNDGAYTVDNDVHSFTTAELNAVERFTGMTVGEWGAKLSDDNFSALAWSALAWTACRRGGLFIRWDEFEASISAYDLVRSFTRTPDDDESAAVDQAVTQALVSGKAQPKAGPNRAARRAKGAATA